MRTMGYKLTTEPSYLVPTTPKSAVGKNTVLARLERAEWLSVYEDDKAIIESVAKELEINHCAPSCLHWDDKDFLYSMFAKLIVVNKGGYISGAAGVWEDHMG